MNIPLLNAAQVTLSIIVPSYNEELRIIPTLNDAIAYLNNKNITFEIIVVDDGSTDSTSTVVNNLSKTLSPNIKLTSQGKNQGKGAAVKKGFLEATGEVVGFMDADGATPIAEIDKLLLALKSCDIAIGSRALFSKDSTVKTVWYRKFLGRVFNSVVNIIALPGIRDTQCGFKFFQRDVAQKIFPLIQTERFGVDVEILYLARKFNFKISEIPINWNNIPGSKVNLLKDSIQMLYDVLRVMVRHSKVQS